MLLPGDNYSEQLMFTLHGYKETWVDGRAATMYAEAISSLERAGDLSKSDRKTLKDLKSNTDGQKTLEFVLDVYDTAKKGARFSRVAAPLILADGPLPFGDVIFAVALGLDFAIAGYNLVSSDD